MRNALYAVLSLALVGSSQGAFDFKGDALGMSLSDFVQKYDRETTDSGRRAPQIIIESLGKNPTSYRKYAMVSASKHYPFEERDEPKGTVAGVPARIAYTFFASSLSDWDLATAPRREQSEAMAKLGYNDLAGRVKLLKTRTWTDEEKSAAGRLMLGSINLHFPTDSFLRVLGALTEKYGAPETETTEAKQNAMGATFSSRVVKWVSDGDTIELTEMSYDIKTAHLEFKRRSVLDRAKVATQAEPNADAKDL